MAIVYLADDARHQRSVAVKVLRPEVGAALGADRFLHEIRITAQLQHPHILPLFDSGQVEDLLYFVMPYVDGETLRDRLNRDTRLAVASSARIAAEVASALDYAHRHGVVHRDIKPGNILLADDQVLVADFGIALAVREAADMRLTSPGLSLGTPQYMSPEQAAGDQPVDGRSDVYALGCVLFEMLAGRAPFPGDNPAAVLRQVLTTDAPVLSSVQPGLPEALDGIVGRALARDPADRFQTAGEFAEALRAVEGRSGPPVLGRGERRALVGLTLAALLAVLGWMALRPREPTPPSVGQTTRVTFDPGVELDPAVSPDGRRVAYAGGTVGRTRIQVRDPGAASPVVLTEGLGGHHRQPRWSPDGTRVRFLVSGDGPPALFEVAATGGTPRRLVELPPRGELQGFGVSQDGRTVAFAVDSVIYLQSLEGGPPRPIATVPDPHSFAWSPDGARLAVVSGNPSFVFGTAVLGNIAPSAILVVNASSGASAALTDRAALNVSPVWAPGGRGLFFVSNRGGARDIWYQALDGGARPQGEPTRLTTGLQAHTIDLSADGARLLYSTLALRSNIYRVPIPGAGRHTTPEEATPVTTGSQAIEGLAVSGDGRWVAFDSDLSGNQEIYRVPSQGGAAQRLTSDPADDFIPVWSPDGRHLAFYSFRTGNRDVFVMDSAGGGLQQVTSDPTHEGVPDWSPDGRSLVFHSNRTGRSELFRVDRSPGDSGWGPARQLTTSVGANPRWSPDGAWIAYRSGFSVAVVPADGGPARTVVPPADPAREAAPHWVAWSRDSRIIYYKTLAPDGTSAIFAVPVEGGAPRPVVIFPDPSRQSSRTEFAVDGRLIYFTLASHEADIWTLELRR